MNFLKFFWLFKNVVAAHICSFVRQFVCFLHLQMFDPPEWPSFLLFCCVFTWLTSRSQFVSAHSINNSQTFFHGSASFWFGLMHHFSLVHNPSIMPRLSIRMVDRQINPDCVTVKTHNSAHFKKIFVLPKIWQECVTNSLSRHFLFVVVRLNTTSQPQTASRPGTAFNEPSIAMCSPRDLTLLSQLRKISEMHFGFQNSQMFPISS